MTFPPVGATPGPRGDIGFCVWAPAAGSDRVTLRIRRASGAVESLPMDPAPRGYWTATLPPLGATERYGFTWGERPTRPDPAARAMPEGIHGLSAVDDPGSFPWTDDRWRAPPLGSAVFYELHLGTFTPEGTFDAAARRLGRLVDLGVTVVELMPVASFPGQRDWGYDGVFPWSVQASYGGPEGFRRFVDAAHGAGLAVVLDFVMNHLGPEGNVLAEFGPYFGDGIATPWGPAVNLDGPDSDEVRRFFGGAALHWLRENHVDGLRLDAVHALIDRSATPFLAELAEAAESLRREHRGPAWLIAETDQNDPRVVRPRSAGGLGLDAQWADDFHHALHVALTGERDGYYADFSPMDLASAFERPFVQAGRYSAWRRRRHGADPGGIPSDRFVVFAQNHDQIGNRHDNARLATLVGGPTARLAIALTILSPYLPLLFMGEEYGEEAPFRFFTDYSDPAVIRGLREGRRREFASFHWAGEVPDPQDPAEFAASRLDWSRADGPTGRQWTEYVRALLRLRRTEPALTCGVPAQVDRGVPEGTLWVRRPHPSRPLLLIARLPGAPPAPSWQRRVADRPLRFDSAAYFGGPVDQGEFETGGPRLTLREGSDGGPR
ncbi:MAG: malto-oligosyltrehalose trehalohydrolase [Thermoplasmata archaeon]